jgi:hypothetical protein
MRHFINGELNTVSYFFDRCDAVLLLGDRLSGHKITTRAEFFKTTEMTDQTETGGLQYDPKMRSRLRSINVILNKKTQKKSRLLGCKMATFCTGHSPAQHIK